MEPQANTAYFIQSRFMSNAEKTFVLDLNNKNDAMGEHVIQWSCHGGDNQQWYFEPSGDGSSYAIRNKMGKLYLEFNEQGELVLADKKNSDTQYFTLTSFADGVEIRNKASNLLVQVPLTTKSGDHVGACFSRHTHDQRFSIRSEIPKKLQLVKVECLQSATGVHKANFVVGAVTTFGGAATGVAGAGLTIAGVATGGVAFAVVGAGFGLASAGSLLADMLKDATSSEDDLYITMDDKKIWPNDAKHGSIDKGKSLDLKLLVSENWSERNRIQLWEHDTVGSNDALTPPIDIDPKAAHWDFEFTVITGNQDEGSLYSLTFLLS